MTAPGPDSVEYENGPIMACDNAIEHYSKRLIQLAEGERRLFDRLMANRKEQEQLRDSKTQWADARAVLERALRSPY